MRYEEKLEVNNETFGEEITKQIQKSALMLLGVYKSIKENLKSHNSAPYHFNFVVQDGRTFYKISLSEVQPEEMVEYAGFKNELQTK